MTHDGSTHSIPLVASQTFLSLLHADSSILMPWTRNAEKWLPFADPRPWRCSVWAGLFALGAYLEPSADKPQHDFRKPLIVLGTMAAFLAFWGVALWRRSRRK